MASLANEIKKLRKQRKLTQTQLAKLSGLNQKDISNFENGHTDVRLSTLQQIAQALDLRLMLVSKFQVAAVNQLIHPNKETDEEVPSLLEQFGVPDDED